MNREEKLKMILKKMEEDTEIPDVIIDVIFGVLFG